MDQSTPGLPLYQQLPEFILKLIPVELVMPSNHLNLCHPLLFPPSIFPSIRVFSNESVFRIRWPNYWSFGFSISPYNNYSGLISCRVDWFDLLAVQGTLKSLLQHHRKLRVQCWIWKFILANLHKYLFLKTVHSFFQFWVTIGPRVKFLSYLI